MTVRTVKVTLPDSLKPGDFLEALNRLGIGAEFEIDDDDVISHNDALTLLYPDKTPGEIAGLHLSAARENVALTQSQLAEKTGTQKEAISAMENGKRPISVKMARKFADVFNVDYKVFL